MILILFFARKILLNNVQHIIFISKSKFRASNISLNMLFSEVNVSSFTMFMLALLQWTLHGAEGFCPTSYKKSCGQNCYHMVNKPG